MFLAPNFLPPAATTARAAAPEPCSTPPICPCCAEQWCRADPATAAGLKAQLPAAVAQEQESLHVEENQTPLVLSRALSILPDTQAFSSLQNLFLGTVLVPFSHWRGGTAQEHAAYAPLACQGGQPHSLQLWQRGDGIILAFT